MISTTEFVKQIAAETHENQSTIKAVIKSLWENIQTYVENGEEVRFIGVGKFYKSHRDERKGRNPKTGEEITISASDKLAFKSATRFE